MQCVKALSRSSSFRVSNSRHEFRRKTGIRRKKEEGKDYIRTSSRVLQRRQTFYYYHHARKIKTSVKFLKIVLNVFLKFY